MAQTTPNIYQKKPDGKKLSNQAFSTTSTSSTPQNNVDIVSHLNKKAEAQPLSTLSTTSQPNTTVKKNQANPVIKENMTLDQALNAYRDFLLGSSENYYENQKSILDNALQQRLNDLKSAYDQAVHEGKISEQEAQEAFEENVRAINEEAYLNSQITDLSAEQRGIGNSQQMIALQQGNQRATQRLMDENRTVRDKRINEIKDRIAQITNQYNMDVTEANTLYYNDLRGARAQADMMYNQSMGDLTLAQYKTMLETKQQLTLMEQQQLYALEQMEKQYGYDLNKMKMQNQYTLEQMAQQQKYDLQKMKTQYGYDVKKMELAFEQDLAKMAKQYGYDMSKINAQHKNQLAQIKAQQKAQIEAQNRAYQQELQRMQNAYLNKNSPEYKIRMAQLQEANDQAILQIANKAKIEALGVISGSLIGEAKEMWKNNPSSLLNQDIRSIATGRNGEPLYGIYK